MRRLREHPSAADAVPLPQWGRLRYEDTAFLDTTPFPRGKAKRRRLRRPKRKPTPPRYARQPLPREGARVVTLSFLWKEVPRRGGGAPKGRRLDRGSGMKKSEEDRLKRVVYESTRAPLTRSPFPNGEGCDTRIPLFSTQRLSQGWKAKSAAASPRIYMGRCPKVCGEQISRLRFSNIIHLSANGKNFSLRLK